ncbi:hypoxanthine phosphoribosyltransferase [Marinitoga sp. 1135]|uniref:Hypoxanthine phosphoribosyltransferase n=1 Tax=Marinitoga piezophila (strain DSM 14283 / JCM 11233 / KA3) TaxID=443254 RepID=H2J801_MARPK|nr:MULTISPECIES: hypoxanthine phosphoribosyltransferase [Marinitoga]AEX85492.1 hypoxanthine phosphoribosyltransferase [Marinitoga piezophila KA3]APT75960.1 hypoxanthine phosphoribosyltransferase [Marinitoga sp. 1137]NUU95702.1 hypoxanthine phosphoribosyltransferase [Marinitoga sp. 1135]NUU97634.1 hypoxanthine phosphoribosyltransferase [Marinitoga sp. 1138]
MNISPENLKVLLTEEQILNKAKELGKEITEYYKDIDEEIVAVCALKGSVHFFADLVKNIEHDMVYQFVSISSYHGGTQSTGKITVNSWLNYSLKGKHVLLIEDIVDTGNTIKFLMSEILKEEPASLKLTSLLIKNAHDHGIKVDFPGFYIDNYFVIGYGLDYDEKYRNLPFIGYVE